MVIDNFTSFIEIQEYPCYCLVDGITDVDFEEEGPNSILAALYNTPANNQFYPLYAQTKLCNYIDISPLIIKIENIYEFNRLVDELNLTNSMVIFSSKYSLDELTNHFQQFLEADLFEETVTFRFYDPKTFHIIYNCVDKTVLNQLTKPIHQACYYSKDNNQYYLFEQTLSQHQLDNQFQRPITIPIRLYNDFVENEKVLFKRQLEAYIASNDIKQLSSKETTEQVLSICEKCNIKNDIGAELIANIFLYDRSLFNNNHFKNSILLNKKLSSQEKIQQIENYYSLYQSGLV